MSPSRTLFIGMDVHKDSLAVAYVAQDHGADVPSLGTMGTRQCAMDPLSRMRPSQAQHLIFVYAAGPCGYWLYRSLAKKGYDCWGVAPSLIPPKPGDRVKTDRRDAVPLAPLARAGDLTVVSDSKLEDEAIRDLTRAPEDTLSALKSAKVRLQAFWRLPPVVEALPALRGVQCTGAVTMVAAIGELSRFATPRARMKCLGLIPSEYPSAERRRQGSMTKTGHPHARRVLVEDAWASRYPGNGSRPLPLRLETPPTVIQDIR